VDDRRDRPSVALDHAHGPIAVGSRRKLHRGAELVDVALLLGNPERQAQRRIPERRGERVAQVRRLRQVREPRHEAAHSPRL
jgi:hypothetical protein